MQKDSIEKPSLKGYDVLEGTTVRKGEVVEANKVSQAQTGKVSASPEPAVGQGHRGLLVASISNTLCLEHNASSALHITSIRLLPKYDSGS